MTEAWLSAGAGGLLTIGWITFYVKVMRPDQTRIDKANAELRDELRAEIKVLRERIVNIEARAHKAELKAERSDQRAERAENAAAECTEREIRLRRVMAKAGLPLEES